MARARRTNRDREVANADLAMRSVHDPLTGAFNRGYLQTLTRQHGDALGKRAVHGGARDCVGLMLLEIDRFKAIVDTHGDAAGDRVLVEIARRLRTLVRDQDAVVRWDDEAFALVLPGAPAQGLEVLATRVLRMIGSEPVRSENTAIRVTVSAGCVAFPLNREKHWDDALQLADAAMHLASERGCNPAVCGLDIREDAAMAAVAGDLAAAETLGRVRLSMLPGPSRPVMVDVATMQ